MKKIILVVFGFACMSAMAATYLVSCLRNFGNYPGHGLTIFYGYASYNNGPGDFAFQQCKDYAMTNGKALLLVYGTDSCASCDEFAQCINPRSVTWSVFLGHMKDCAKGYFRGNNAGTSPKAVEEAKKFIDNLKKEFPSDEDPRHINWSSTCHLAVMYSEKPNGQKFVRANPIPLLSTTMHDDKGNTIPFADGMDKYQASAVKFKYLIHDGTYLKNIDDHQATKDPNYDGWYNEWKDWWTNDTDDVYCPNASFMTNCVLYADEKLEQVHVPFARTNNLSFAQTNWLEITYPSRNVATNTIAWLKSMTNIDSVVDVTGNWVASKQIQLVLIDTNKVAIATNYINCVKHH